MVAQLVAEEGAPHDLSKEEYLRLIAAAFDGKLTFEIGRSEVVEVCVMMLGARYAGVTKECAAYSCFIGNDVMTMPDLRGLHVSVTDDQGAEVASADVDRHGKFKVILKPVPPIGSRFTIRFPH
jgi:hypothetical protein